MAREFKENAHLKIDQDKFKENFDRINWKSKEEQEEIDKEKVARTKKNISAGICGEFGMSVFDKKSFDENFDRIKWKTKGADKENEQDS